MRFLARAIALAGTVVAVSVCGEQGRFGGTTGPTGTGVDTSPPRVTLTIADSIVEITDSLRFTAQASDSVRLKKVTLVVTGVGAFAASLDSTLEDSTFSTTTTVSSFAKAYVVPLPSNAAGQRIAITLAAEDGNSNLGYTVDTVLVNDGQPPTVTLSSPSAGVLVGAGEQLSIVMRAVDPSGILRAGARLFVRDTILQRITTLAVDSTVYTAFGTSKTDTFVVTVPATLQPGTYLVQVFAVDNSPSFNAGSSTPDVAISVRDVLKPTGSFLNPPADSSVTAGDTVTVRFRAVDFSGVTRVAFRGYSLRGDPTLGTDTTVLRYQSVVASLPLIPTDTSPIVRRLAPVMSDGTAEPVYIEAVVRDVGGNETTLTQRVQVVAGLRSVTFVSPPQDSGVGAGDSLLVQFRVQDRRGISQIRIEGVALRGDSSLGTNAWVARFAQKTIQSLPLPTDTTLRRYLNASDTGRVEPVYLRVTAYTSGGDSLQAMQRIQVISGPSVQLLSPSRDTTHAVGSALGVAASGFDPDSVKVIGYVYSGRISGRDSTVFSSPLSTTQSGSWPLSVPGTTLEGPDTLTPFVIDRFGNRTVGRPVVVSFRDLTPPTVAWVSPSADTGVVAGDSVRVQVRVRDNAPGTTVTISGRSGGADWFSAVSFSVTSTDTTVARYMLATPQQDVAGGLVDLVVTARDRANNPLDSIATAAATRRIQVASGPYVRVEREAGQDTIRLGQTGADLLVTISSFNRDTITYLGYDATGRVTVSDSVPPTRPVTTSYLSQELHLVIPDTAHLGTVTVTPFVRTKAGTRITGPAVAYLIVDGSLPTVRILAPARAGTDRVPAGDSVFVRVAVADDRALATLKLAGYARRPDVSPDSLAQVVHVLRYDEKVVQFTSQVRDTVVRYLNAVLTDSTAENVYIVATAEDAAGNVGVDTVKFISIPGSYVRITAPTSPTIQPIGSTMSVTVTAFDPDSVSKIGILATGEVTGGDSISYASPLALTQTTTRTISVPTTATTGTITVTPFAEDRLGNRITGAALIATLADTAKPTVTIDTPAVALFPVASGDSVYVRARVTDNVGVTRVTMTGISRRGVVSLGTDTVVTRFTAKTVTLASKLDTTLTRYLLADTGSAVSEIAYLVVTAEDSAGNSASATASIRIVGGPVLSIERPISGAATSEGKSVIIEIRGVDANGVRLIGWRATGVLTAQDSLFFGPVSGDLRDDTTFVDTLAIPVGTPVGTITITPFGSDSLGDISASIPGVNIAVESAAADATGPAVQFSIGRRVEADDSVAVSATDAGGLKYVGFAATLLGTPTDTVGADSTLESGTYTDVTRSLSLALDPAIRFPSQVVVTGFGVDQSGNRAVSATVDTLTVVAGKTYQLPAGSRIADAIYNQRRRELYLSNYPLDRIEVFDLAANAFVASIPVGSRPWGLALWPRASANRSDPTAIQYDDTLIVANSGGTNLSIVNLQSRVEERRHRLPNYHIERIKKTNNDAGGESVDITLFDLSDRPQYVAAVCRAGGLTTCDSVIAVYSTTPTSGQTPPYQGRGYVAWENLSQTAAVSGKGHFFWEQANVQEEGVQDTIQIVATLYTAAGGTFADTIVGGAMGYMLDRNRLVFRDTTYVRSSGNYDRVIIGEGGGGLNLARVLAYDGSVGRTRVTGASVTLGPYVLDSLAQVDLGITNAILVQDFIGNRASSVTAVAANFDGATNLVRADSIYVFDNSLRQTGLLQVSGQAHGMDLAPLHAFSANARGTDAIAGNGDADERIVFAARPDSSIDVFDTYFFGRVTDPATADVPIPIRNALVGSVRVTPDMGGTVLTGITNQGLVVVRLPSLTNPFPTPQFRPPAALRPRSPRETTARGRGTAPPRE